MAYLHARGQCKKTKIGVTQPRQARLPDIVCYCILTFRVIATKASTQRVAAEMGCLVGDTVGYQVRFDNTTRLVILGNR